MSSDLSCLLLPGTFSTRLRVGSVVTSAERRSTQPSYFPGSDFPLELVKDVYRCHFTRILACTRQEGSHERSDGVASHWEVVRCCFRHHVGNAIRGVVLSLVEPSRQSYFHVSQEVRHSRVYIQWQSWRASYISRSSCSKCTRSCVCGWSHKAWAVEVSIGGRGRLGFPP